MSPQQRQLPGNNGSNTSGRNKQRQQQQQATAAAATTAAAAASNGSGSNKHWQRRQRQQQTTATTTATEGVTAIISFMTLHQSLALRCDWSECDRSMAPGRCQRPVGTQLLKSQLRAVSGSMNAQSTTHMQKGHERNNSEKEPAQKTSTRRRADGPKERTQKDGHLDHRPTLINIYMHTYT